MTLIINDNGIDRPMTDDEAAAFLENTETERNEAAHNAEIAAAQEAVKQSARAKLAALGLTDDEVAALIP